MEDTTQNKDIKTNSSPNAMDDAIAVLQAQITALQKNNNVPSNKSENVDYKLITNSEETSIDTKNILLLGATIGDEIKTMRSSLDEYKGYLSTSAKEKIEYVLRSTDENLKKEAPDLNVAKNDLSLLVCKIFFDYEGVDVPDHLMKKVEKIKDATRYTASIKEEIRDLLPHVPYQKKNLQSIIDRKKNAGVDFDGFNSSKRNTEWYISKYSQGATTAKEMKDYLDRNPAEKQRYHELIDDTVNSYCQKRGYKRPSGIIRGINNYTFGVAQ